MAVPLPLNQSASVNGRNQIRRETGRVGGHQEVAVVGRRVVQSHGLNGIVERRGATKRPESFRLHRIEDRGVDGDAALARHLECQDGKDVVMAGDAGPFGDKLGGRMFERWERAFDSLADFLR